MRRREVPIPRLPFEATHRRLLAGAALAVFLALALAPASIWAAPPTVIANVKLPSARAHSAAVAAGDAVYIFGGETSSGDTGQTLRFDSASSTLATRAAVLNPPLHGVAAGWDGHHVYLFGGSTDTCTGGIACPKDAIQRYDPSSDAVTTRSSKLPVAADGLAGVWTGRYFFLFGPTTTDPAGAKIVRYDPVKDLVYTTGYALPDHRRLAAAVWDGTNAYVFGGNDNGVGKKTILKFNPTTGQVATVSDTLPTERHAMGALWDGRYAYLLGGFDQTTPDLEGVGVVGELDEIVRFDPGSGDAALLTDRLPAPRSSAPAATTGSKGYLFGGFSGGYSDQILSYAVQASTPPRASLDVTSDGRTISVDARASTDAETSIATYLWDWGDQTNPSTASHDTHTYAGDGPYTLRLYVTDSTGLASGASRTISFGDGQGSGGTTTTTGSSTTTTTSGTTTTTRSGTTTSGSATTTTRSGTTTSGTRTSTTGSQDLEDEAGDGPTTTSPAPSTMGGHSGSASWTSIQDQDKDASPLPTIGAVGVLAAMVGISAMRRTRR